MKRVLIYTRISLDRQGDSVSPARQEALCRQLAEAREYEVGAVYEDPDASGWRRGAKRPGFKALEAAVQAGETDAVMAYSLSRFGRRATALLEFAERLKDRGVDLLLYDQGVDTSTPAGQMFFTILAAFAEMESAQTSEKVKSHHRLAASQGKMHKGGVRGFGYGQTTGDKEADARVGDQVNRAEAQAVRTVTEMLLDHKSLGSCARWLNEQGVTTTKGNLWNSQTLSQALRAPRIGGLRHHDGANLPGDWKSVLDEGTWTRLVAELDSRRNKGSGRSVPAHLLTGLAKCGRCGCSLRAASFRQANGKMFDRYQCLPREGLPNCGSLAASKATVDSIVTERFLDFMSSASLRPVEDRSADLQGEADELERKINKLTTDHYVHGRLTDATFTAAYDPLAAELALVQQAQRAAAIQRSDASRMLEPGSREAMEAWWAKASLEDKRAALARAIYKIKIRPAARRGGNKFDTNRVEIRWRWDLYRQASETEWEQMTPEEQDTARSEAVRDNDEIAELELSGRA